MCVRRIDELREQARAAAGSVDAPALTFLNQCLDRYRDIRSCAFKDLICIINDAVIGTGGLQDHWQARTQQAQDDLNRNFGDGIRDVLMSANLQSWWAGMVQFENNFFQQLGAARTPQFVQDLLTHQGGLADMIDRLSQIWTALLSTDQDQEAQQMRVVQELDQLIQTLAEDVAKEHQAIVIEAIDGLRAKIAEKAQRVKDGLQEKIGEKATKVATVSFAVAIGVLKDKLKDVFNWPSALDRDAEAQGEKIKELVGKTLAFSQGYRDLTARYRDLMSTEKGGVLTMFKQTRDQVTEYERNNNLVIAQIMRDEAKRFLNDWAEHCVAEQRDDAAEFNKAIFSIIDRNWTVTEAMARQFQTRFSGVFYAPLTSDTLESLTESFMFRKAIDSVNERQVTKVITDAQRMLIESVDPAVARAMQPLDSLSTDWSDALKAEASIENEEFHKYLRDKLKSQIDLAVNSLGELRFLIDPPKVIADFTREELDAMLRG